MSGSGPPDHLAERRRIDEATRDVPDYFNRAVNVVNGWLMEFNQPASRQTADFVIANAARTSEGTRSYTTAHWQESVHFAGVAWRDRDGVAAAGAVANFLGGFVNPHVAVPGTYNPVFRNLGTDDQSADLHAAFRAMTDAQSRQRAQDALRPLNFTAPKNDPDKV
ncbi:hypothetical protein [Roseomonas fluvialis]|uniref:Uncharacterized protein n=1 Tax=Roseomonas fluvialis TaxID=1750527 RepID=A0ABM7Y635_9PROT|nr:hypothetical protein [Roseomonas fluvialis]BDG73377.1 hypothetical protein Rmf_33060 [Roseomonas fluvialis]